MKPKKETKEEPKEKKAKGKKKRSGWRKFFLGVGVVLLLLIIFLGYLGFVPGLSNLLGATTPRDLGVRYTDQDLFTARDSLGVSLQELPATTSPANSIVYEGQKDVDASFTNEEATALLDNQKWKYSLSKDTQIKASDGGIELSGVLLRSNLEGYGDATGVQEYEKEAIRDGISWVKTNPRMYIKAKGHVKNNKVSLDIEEAELGRVKIPKSLVPKTSVERFIEDRLNQMDGLDLNLDFEEGKVNMGGKVPAVEKAVWQ